MEHLFQTDLWFVREFTWKAVVKICLGELEEPKNFHQ